MSGRAGRPRLSACQPPRHDDRRQRDPAAAGSDEITSRRQADGLRARRVKSCPLLSAERPAMPARPAEEPHPPGQP